MTTEEPQDGQIGAATKALTEAIGNLTAAVTDALKDSGKETVSRSLEAISRQLAAASDSVVKAKDAVKKIAPEHNETRNAIVASAQKVFAAKGYEGASIAEIAAQAGFTKGAVYMHFPSKEALFLATVEEHWNDRLKRFRDDVPSEAMQMLPPWECSEQSTESALLTLEMWIYGVRHPGALKKLSSTWNESLEVTARALANLSTSTDSAFSPTEIAFLTSAVHTMGIVLSTALESEEIAAIEKSIVRRLLGLDSEQPPHAAD